MHNPYHTVVLLGIDASKTYREIADDMGKSHGMVQYYLREVLEPQGYVSHEVNPKTGRAKARSLKLTDKGKKALKEEGYEPR